MLREAMQAAFFPVPFLSLCWPKQRSHRKTVPAIMCTSVTGSASGLELNRKWCVEFRPCIDIHKGKVKQIVGSSLCDQPRETGESLVTNFESSKSAAEFAELYKRDGLRGGHVIMLGQDRETQAAAIEALAAFPGGLQVGGSVTPNNAKSYLDVGASHVIVTSYIFVDGRLELDRLKELSRIVGKSRLVLDLSCRKKQGQCDCYAVVTNRWQKFSDLVLTKNMLQSLSEFADEFLVHGVDVEGKKLGIDEELVHILGKWSPIPVTYAGGATKLADLELIRIVGDGVVNVTVGSALDIFGGELPYTEVVQWHKRQNRNHNAL